MPDSPYQRQFLVCTFGPWCRLEGSEHVQKALKAKVKEAGLDEEIRVTKSGCLGQCGHGPMAAAWPENVWYHKLRVEDVDALFEQHVRGRQAVERLRYRPEKSGGNKTPGVKAKEAEKGKITE